VKDLKKKISPTESDRGKLEHSLPCHIEKQDVEHKPTDNIEETLRRQFQDHREKGDLESMSDPRKIIRYIYNHLMY
jgi:hypothetical protein